MAKVGKICYGKQAGLECMRSAGGVSWFSFVGGVAEVLDQMPKMERMLTRATLETSKELKLFVINIDQTIAMISRARGIGERVLRQARVETVEKTSLAETSTTAGMVTAL